jgi:hypothetical protein
MDTPSRLIQRKNNLHDQLATLGPMRKGTLNEQYVQTILKDGSARRRGPYTVYTFKEHGQTVSRRLSDHAKIALYREQIATFRRFQELTRQLAQISQRLADLAATDDAGSKKNSRR